MARREAKAAQVSPAEYVDHLPEPEETKPARKASDFQEITVEFTPPVARIALNSPPLNIISMRMMEELVAVMERVDDRSDIHIVVLTGAADGFCAGVDIRIHTPDKVQWMLAKMGSVFRAVLETRKITIAAVRGHCLGGGAEIAMVCDLVYTTEDANWGFPEISLACFPPFACAALPALIGQKRAADLILTGHSFNGREAVNMGLATEFGPDSLLEERVRQTTEQLSKLSPAALALTKKAMHSWDSFHLDKGFQRAEKIYLEELMQTPDAREAISAWLEKREPVWKKAA
jgi:cyclohexa-1,5-dienecarbonyl-CoA hydratase